MLSWLQRVRTRRAARPPIESVALGVGAAPVAHAPLSCDAELFIALNMYEEADYAGALQTYMDSQNKVHDMVLTQWQKQTMESVLFFDGGRIISMRFNPKSFLGSKKKH